MAINYAQIISELTNEIIGNIPTCHFQLSGKKQLLVIGDNFDEHGGIEDLLVGVDQKPAKSLGRLNMMEEVSQQMLRNGLVNEKWNFELWPNPEVILLELK